MSDLPVPDAAHSVERVSKDEEPAPIWSKFQTAALTQEQAEHVLDRLAEGATLAAAAREVGVRANEVLRAAAEDPEFALALQLARELATEAVEARLRRIALEGAPDSMATIRAAETYLRGMSARYAKSGRTQVEMRAPGGGKLRVNVVTPIPW